ncbi:hypothetical protein, partial [Oleiphilus sp. HI0066]|uniref:hypothetical protein n=2 Tax=Oleiphilus TaxID=141450 RepID=UPI0018D4D214
DVLELANDQLSLTGNQQFGSASDQIIATDLIQVPELDLGATLPFLSFVSELYNGGTVSGYEMSTMTYSAGTFSRESVYISVSSLSKAELGFDASGFGVAAWLEGASSSTRLKVSRFNGFRWNDPVTVNPSQGDITDKRLSVFQDGQSLFAWVEKGVSTSFIKSQGYFPIDGANAYSLVPVQTIDSLSGDYTGLQLSADREGNAHLAVSAQGSFLTTFRFLHNIEWNEAWSDAETITNNSKANVYEVEMIKKDGRSLMLYANEALSYDRFYAQPFSDFE